MQKSLNINFLKYQEKLAFRKEEGKLKIYDPIRKKYFIKTPEEIVRQLVVQYLILDKNFNKNKISVERMLKVNGLPKRFDILIYDEKTKPHLLVECKAPSVKLTQDTFRQIANYNLPLQVKFLLVTNGITTYCCEMDYEKQSFEFMTEVPSYNPISS